MSASRPAGAGECGTKKWNKSASGYPDDLSVEQAAVLERFKETVTLERLHQCRFTHETVDGAACRYLRARQFGLKEAAKMFLESVEWRRTFAGGVVQLGRTSTIEVLGDKSGDELQAFYAHRYLGTRDKQGRPIYVERTGVVDAESLAAVVGLDNLVKYHVSVLEGEHQVELLRASEAEGRPVLDVLSIVDLAGMSSSILNKHTKAYFKAMSSIDQNRYPETLGKLFVVNAPTVFAAVWKVAKKFLDKRTVDKISILPKGAAAQAELLKHIPAESLPIEYGGSLDMSASGGLFPPSKTRVVKMSSKLKFYETTVDGLKQGQRVRFRFHSKGGGMTFAVTLNTATGPMPLIPPTKIEKLVPTDKWVTLPADGALHASWKPSRASGRTLYVRIDTAEDLEKTAAFEAEKAAGIGARIEVGFPVKMAPLPGVDSDSASTPQDGATTTTPASAGVSAGAGSGAGAGAGASGGD